MAVNGGITNEVCKVANITWGYEDTLWLCIVSWLKRKGKKGGRDSRHIPNIKIILVVPLHSHWYFCDSLIINPFAIIRTVHGWFKYRLMLYVTTIMLTAADVSCTVANTRKMVNWRMCCMVSEESHCSSEVQYMKLIILAQEYQH